MIDRDIYKRGHLTALPDNQKAKERFTTGVQPLHLDNERDGYIYVPVKYRKDHPAALAVMLHGAGGDAEQGLWMLHDYADAANIILLAPASRQGTWDIIASDAFNADVIFLDEALTLLFEQFAIDPLHLAIGGFSDGASYALCLGISNGNLFTHIIAFSPGFVYAAEKRGKLVVFISHGVKDRVLPIDACSRRVVPQLQRQGYAVNYKEFSDGHEIPSAISQAAVNWFLQQQKA